MGEATQNSRSSPIVLFNIGTSSSNPQWPTDVMSLLSLSHTTTCPIYSTFLKTSRWTSRSWFIVICTGRTKVFIDFFVSRIKKSSLPNYPGLSSSVYNTDVLGQEIGNFTFNWKQQVMSSFAPFFVPIYFDS